MLRNRVFALINIFGLAIGMGCALITSMFVIDELSYENFNRNGDRVYRIVMKDYIGSPAPLATALKNNLPEVEETVRIDNFTRRTKKLFSYGEKRFYESRFLLAEPSLFKIFTFPFVRGNPETALNHPDSIVLTEGTAYKYFGSENPLGKRIRLENRWEFTVTGILKDVPENSHLKFDLLAPFSFNEKEERYGKDLYHKNWGQANFITYILLAEGVSPEGLEEKIKQVTKDVGAYPRYNWTYYIQSLNDIHLKSDLRAEIEANGSLATLWFYSLIGLIVLVIACINYMNLATAQFAKRAKEVGMRKVAGANRSQLINQFFGESFLISVIALIFALALVELVLPAFNSLTGKNLTLAGAPVSHFLLLAGTVIVTGIGAGIYPALFLSAFKPVKVFRSGSSLVSRGAGLRKVLVLVQFSLSILFIISTLVVWNQLKFIKNKKLGLNKEQVVNVPLFEEVRDKYEAIKDEIKKHSGVVSAAASNFSPSQAPYRHGLWWEGMTKDDNKMMHWLAVDHDFLEMFEIELLEGRDFSRQFSTDTVTAYIFNESAVKEFGKDFIKGRKFGLFGEKRKAPVIGIVRDFHYKSLHRKLEPVILCVYPKLFTHISARIETKDVPGVLSHIERAWKAFLPHRPFEYQFLDEEFDRLYRAEERTGKLCVYFTLLAIFISCLGLFALASFMVEQRTKEIGVRKVLGATIPGIVTLLSKDFTKWVLIANLFAWPIAYYIMKEWLRNFAYRINIGVEIFVLSGLTALAIALVTVSYQCIRAAAANPVEALKYE